MKQLEQKAEYILSILEELLDMENEYYEWDLFTTLKEELGDDYPIEITQNIGAVFIKPGTIPYVKAPLIVINDTIKIADFDLLHLLAHEFRHFWQTKQRNQLWINEFESTPRKRGIDEDSSIEQLKTDALTLDTEKDAYAFQIVFVKLMFEHKNIDFPEPSGKFYELIKDKVDSLYNLYKEKFNKIMKKRR